MSVRRGSQPNGAGCVRTFCRAILTGVLLTANPFVTGQLFADAPTLQAEFNKQTATTRQPCRFELRTTVLSPTLLDAWMEAESGPTRNRIRQLKSDEGNSHITAMLTFYVRPGHYVFLDCPRRRVRLQGLHSKYEADEERFRCDRPRKPEHAYYTPNLEGGLHGLDREEAGSRVFHAIARFPLSRHDARHDTLRVRGLSKRRGDGFSFSEARSYDCGPVLGPAKELLRQLDGLVPASSREPLRTLVGSFLTYCPSRQFVDGMQILLDEVVGTMLSFPDLPVAKRDTLRTVLDKPIANFRGAIEAIYLTDPVQDEVPPPVQQACPVPGEHGMQSFRHYFEFDHAGVRVVTDNDSDSSGYPLQDEILSVPQIREVLHRVFQLTPQPTPVAQ